MDDDYPSLFFAENRIQGSPCGVRQVFVKFKFRDLARCKLLDKFKFFG